MTTVDEHAAHVAAMLGPAIELRRDPGADRLPLDDALGRVTAAAVHSPVDLPLFRNSQMDGFAVRSADLPGTLPIIGEVSARPSDPPALQPGTAVRIMTGAVVPEGADAVVPVEDTTVDAEEVTVERVRMPGEFVRDRGSDVRRGAELLPAGLRLAARHLAVLAAAGITAVEVRRNVRVAVITTGSELIEPGAVPVLGQVFDSNGTALAAAIRSAGAVVASRVHVGDDTGAMLRALRDAAAAADLILTSGGISMGDYEVVRETLGPLGARVGHVDMQPGGPQATGLFEGVPVICFPGNPVSTQISFEVFVAPLLRSAAGLPPALRETRRLGADAVSVAGKVQFLRGRIEGDGSVALVAGPGSHLVAGLAASGVLVVVPAATTTLSAGDDVEVLHL